MAVCWQEEARHNKKSLACEHIRSVVLISPIRHLLRLLVDVFASGFSLSLQLASAVPSLSSSVLINTCTYCFRVRNRAMAGTI